ncbi:MAG: hypothetical protein N4A64_12885 [Marinisporobacter sp.]|jgi:hypothetical protein|nr:hypothetical protein [Marinisporobacter sp.]
MIDVLEKVPKNIVNLRFDPADFPVIVDIKKIEVITCESIEGIKRITILNMFNYKFSIVSLSIICFSDKDFHIEIKTKSFSLNTRFMKSKKRDISHE